MRARGSEVRMEWRSNDMDTAREQLADRIKGIPGDHAMLTDSGASSVDAFMGYVQSIELVRLQTYEKLESTALPFAHTTLSSLTTLKVSTDDVLTDGTLDALLRPSLLELDLAGQKLTHTRVDQLFTNLPSMLPLTTLRLRRNQLARLCPEALARCPMLTELDAAENRITDVPSNLLQMCRYLEVLNLESNRLAVPALGVY